MNKPQIVIVAGTRNSGKTTYLKEVRQRAQKRGLQVGGFLSSAQWENGEKVRYYLTNLQTNESRLLARRGDTTAALKTGRYAFDSRVFDWGNRFVRQQTHLPIIMLDEFGPLEQKQNGWYDLLIYLLRHYQGRLFLSVRTSLLPHLLHLINKIRTENT